jgi:AcrR family transcriptional regulator
MARGAARSQGKRRAPLSRDRVLRAAADLADREGIESLSMRKLGQELGVEAMSLYNHVANKDEILGGIADIVGSEIYLPSPRTGWRTAMRRRAISAREVFARHPWLSSVLEARIDPPVPATLRQHNAVIGSLRAGGFSIGAAAHAFSVLDCYVYGWARQEVTLPFDTSDEVGGLAEASLAQLPRDDYPHIVEMITEYILRPGYSYADEFEFGLDLILDALEKLRDVPGASARRSI